jgi:glutamine amidotransferase
MCRWLAYSGSPVRIEDLLSKPRHSLIDQSLHSQLGARMRLVFPRAVFVPSR